MEKKDQQDFQTVISDIELYKIGGLIYPLNLMPNPKPTMSKAFKDQMGKGRPKEPERIKISVTLSSETVEILRRQPENRGKAIDKFVQEWAKRTDAQNNP